MSRCICYYDSRYVEMVVKEGAQFLHICSLQRPFPVRLVRKHLCSMPHTLVILTRAH